MAHQDRINRKYLKAAAGNDLMALLAAIAYRGEHFWTAETLYGAEIDARDGQGRTALILASMKGHQQMAAHIATLFRNKNVELVKATDKSGNTALHHACQYSGHQDLVSDLVALKLDVNQANFQGETPLILAIKGDHGHLANVLIAHGADVNKQDNKGRTPLVHAVLYCKKHVVEQLLLAGADPNRVDNAGNTPLHCLLDLASSSSNISTEFLRETAALLVAKGTDLAISNNRGRKLADSALIKSIVAPTAPVKNPLSGMMKKIFPAPASAGDKDIYAAFVEEGFDPAQDEHWRAIGQSVIEHVIASVDNPRILSTSFNFSAGQCTTQVRNIVTGKVTASTVESIEAFANPAYVAEAHEKLVAMGKTPPPLPSAAPATAKIAGLAGKL